jgi:hypothetical protein
LPGGPVQRSPPGLPVMHLVLKHALSLFKGNLWPEVTPGVIVPDERHMVEATVSIAVHATAMIAQINRAEDVLDCLEAFSESDMVNTDPALVASVGACQEIDPGKLGRQHIMQLQLLQLPHYNVDQVTPWLGTILAALLQRAAALRLHSGGLGGSQGGQLGADAEEMISGMGERFQAAFTAIFAAFSLHLMSMISMIQSGVSVQDHERLRNLVHSDVAQGVSALCNATQYSSLTHLLGLMVDPM